MSRDIFWSATGRQNPLRNWTPTNPFCAANPVADHTIDGLYVLVDDVVWHPHGVVQACAWSIPGVPGRVVASTQSAFFVEASDGSYATTPSCELSSELPPEQPIRFSDLRTAASYLLVIARRHNP